MGRAAHALSVANTHISADVIEVEEFPALAREYQMTGVPKTIINDKVGFVGDLPDEAFLNAILETLGLPPTDMAEPPVEVT